MRPLTRGQVAVADSNPIPEEVQDESYAQSDEGGLPEPEGE